MSRDEIAVHLHKVLQEFTEGYVIVGLSAADNKPIARFWFPDEDVRAKVNKILADIHAAGGLPLTDDAAPIKSESWTKN